MLRLGDVFLCEKVVFSPNGEPREFIGMLSDCRVDVYPFTLRCSLVINFIHSEAFQCILGARIIDGDRVLFKGAPVPVQFGRPPFPDQAVGFVSRLPDIEIEKPGKYTLELLVNNIVKHRQALSFN